MTNLGAKDGPLSNRESSMNRKPNRNRVGSRTMKKALLERLDQTKRPIEHPEPIIEPDVARKLLIEALAEGARIRRERQEPTP